MKIDLCLFPVFYVSMYTDQLYDNNVLSITKRTAFRKLEILYGNQSRNETKRYPIFIRNLFTNQQSFKRLRVIATRKKVDTL